MNQKIVLLALVCMTSSASAASGQVYKWTDAAGVVHYSDAPPPKDTLSVQTVRVTGGDRPHAIPSERGEPAAKPADAGTAKAPPQNVEIPDTPDNRARTCTTARSNLELLQSKYPISVAGADGKAQMLDDKGRQAQVAAANAQIAQFCQ